MTNSISQYVSSTLQKTNIKQLLQFIVLSCSAAIIVLAISTILIEKAVKGMLPINRLGRQLFKNLYVYEGAEHPHAAQKPKEVKL